MCNPITTHNPGCLLEKGIYEGFEWEITSNRMGFRCGYVRVPAGHPWHGKDYDEIDAEVHGGLTFASPDADCGKGGDDADWWVGFDAAHIFDAPDPLLPGYVSELERYGTVLTPDATVKTTEYMVAECRRLIEQAAEAA